MKKTLYEILGVEPSASAQDISSAYAKRLAAMQVGDGPVDRNLPILLREAHEVLSDPLRRSAYDESLAETTRFSAGRRRERDPSSLRTWGGWIAGAAALIGLGFWW